MQIKTKIDSCHTADSKPVKQEVNGTMILPPLVFPGLWIDEKWSDSMTQHIFFSIVIKNIAECVPCSAESRMYRAQSLAPQGSFNWA